MFSFVIIMMMFFLQSIVLSGLKAFTKYRLRIKAYNELGSGPPVNITIRTAEGGMICYHYSDKGAVFFRKMNLLI